MDQAWEDIDQGWKDLQQGMTEIGITKPSGASDGMVRLNVGGSQVNVRRSVLDGKPGTSSPSGWTLGNLFEARWNVIPMDMDGRYVLDESPVAVKHLIHALLAESSAAEGAGESAAPRLIAHEKPYVPFVSRALGLSAPTAMAALEASTILVPAVSDSLGAARAALLRWFPDETFDLQYRATRDGWSGSAFRAACGDDSRRTVSLFRVGSGRSASVIGGFSSVSWSGEGGCAKSPGAFVFMLRDGTSGRQKNFQPTKWGIRDGHELHAVCRTAGLAPCFGHKHDLTSALDGSPGTLNTNNKSYDIPAGSAFLQLNGHNLSEIEVFRVSRVQTAAPRPHAALAALHELGAPAVMPMQGEDDVRNFGVRIAGSLMEERMALRDAENELRRAGASALVAVIALEAVYGPDIAAGREDPVVELSVRGIRMTTLRSTLQVCPDSALATLVDETGWPVHEKDMDEHGRPVIDCNPAVFSKVLDVLRMRKRTGWTGGEAQQPWLVEPVRVAVKAADRKAFEGFVNTQFSGCESFIMDYVDFLEELQPAV
eukprot:g16545.t1